MKKLGIAGTLLALTLTVGTFAGTSVNAFAANTTTTCTGTEAGHSNHSGSEHSGAVNENGHTAHGTNDESNHSGHSAGEHKTAASSKTATGNIIKKAAGRHNSHGNGEHL